MMLANSPARYDHVKILGVRVDVIEMGELMSYIEEVIHQNGSALIANLNIHAINHAYELAWFRDFTNNSEMVVCDGFGIKWASKFFYGKDLFRYTHVDWFEPLADTCVRNNFSLYFLGAQKSVVERAASIACERHPGLVILGTHDGYFDKSEGSEENNQLIEKINSLTPDILIVGFGMPIQEKWLLENRSKLNAHIIITAGGFFDYLSGNTKRAPHWMTDHGLEWLGRLIFDPVRLWRRYLIGNPVFFWRIITHQILRIPLPY